MLHKDSHNSNKPPGSNEIKKSKNNRIKGNHIIPVRNRKEQDVSGQKRVLKYFAESAVIFPLYKSTIIMFWMQSYYPFTNNPTLPWLLRKGNPNSN